MKRILAAFALLCASVWAQQTPSQQFQEDFISSLNSTGCVSVPSGGLNTGSFSVSGSWTGTLTAYGVVGQGTPVALTSVTANGSSTVLIGGYTLFKVCGNTVATGTAFVQVYATSTPGASIASSTQGWAYTGSSNTGGFASPLQVDAAGFDLVPTSPTTPCQDMLNAELSGVRGNYAVPTSGLGLSSGTKLLFNCNPLATAKNGSLYLPSALLQAMYSFVIPNQQGTNSGPTNVFMTGHSGTCGANGACATMIQAQVGMWLAQRCNVQVTNGNPPTVAGSVPSAFVDGCVFNSAWVGLSFGMYDPTTGNFFQSVISAVTCTNASSIPCNGGASLSLTGNNTWTGPTSANQSFFIGFPGTVTISGSAVTGTGTSFNAAMVGSVFDASTLSNTGGGCTGPSICTISSVTDATHLTLSGTFGGQTCNAGAPCTYYVGSAYGPIFEIGQAQNPTSQGSSVANGTLNCNAGAGLQHGCVPFESKVGQEQTYSSHIKTTNADAAQAIIGGGGVLDNTPNSGPYSDFEMVYSNSGPSNAINVTPATSATITSGSVLAGTPDLRTYPGRMSYAIYTFAAAPVPNIAEGQIMQCTGSAVGGAGTVYSPMVAQVIAQITPTSAWVLIPNPGNHANDSFSGATATCYFYTAGLVTGNHPFYRNRGIWNATINAGTGGGNAVNYLSNKAIAFDGTSVSNLLPVGAELAGGAGCEVHNIFVQGYDVGVALGETGPLAGCNLSGIDGGGSGTGTTGMYISSQFPVLNTNIFGILATSGFPTTPVNTLVDAKNSNTYPFASNEDIGFYLLDGTGFPFTNANCLGTTATCTNEWVMNGNDGLSLYKGGTTPLFNVNIAGIAHSTGNTSVLTADSSAITATTPAGATFLFAWTNTQLSANTKYSFHCSGTTTQATAGAGIGISIVTQTTATQLEAHATVATSASATASSSTGSVSSTSAQSVYAGATGTLTTQLPWSVDGSIEVGATVPTNFAIGFYSSNASDAVTVKRDSYCTLY